MDLIDVHAERWLAQHFFQPIAQNNLLSAAKSLPQILDYLYEQIPQKRRISYGRVYTIKVLSEYLFNQLSKQDAFIYSISFQLFKLCKEIRSKGVALGILSHYGLTSFTEILPHFCLAAASTDWEMREFAQMFFRKIIRKHPTPVRRFLLSSVKSKDANLRRFVAETLRPVQENQWIYSNPKYSVSILRFLFTEARPYPRTSVGNNLSDLARRLPDMVYGLVEELVESGNKNSYWIAYRACRNLVKKEPLKVMDLLAVDEYRYKKRVYQRNDYVDGK
jgi:3-methyladenine DNA glycosylase AlkC